MARLPSSFYVHVPFCQARCRYCDFHSRVSSAEAMTEFLDALEIDITRLPGRPRTRTFYVGGGTPTALAPALFERLVGILDARFRFESAEEVTFEANPGTLTPASTEVLLRHGVNRLSFGVQTFQDPLLRLLGRLHDAATAQGAIHAAHAAGMENVSLDLIYGIPGSTLETWRDDLEQAVSLDPQHLSVYGLSIESGTVFDSWTTEGRITPLEADDMADRYELAVEVLRAAGFEQYEISNFARPGHACRHNMAIWKNRPYLGFGPSAASYHEGVRSRNVCSTVEYARRVRRGESSAEESEQLPPNRALGEAMMLALRLNEGVTAGEVKRRYGVDPLVRYRRPFARFSKAGLLSIRRNRIQLTDRGRLLADEVFQAFVSAGSTGP